MSAAQLTDFLAGHWPSIREQLLAGRYAPAPVKRVEIPKPDGDVFGDSPKVKTPAP